MWATSWARCSYSGRQVRLRTQQSMHSLGYRGNRSVGNDKSCSTHAVMQYLRRTHGVAYREGAGPNGFYAAIFVLMGLILLVSHTQPLPPAVTPSRYCQPLPRYPWLPDSLATSRAKARQTPILSLLV